MQFGNWNRLKRKAAGWVGSALQLSAPAGKVFLERAAANLAQPIGLADVFNLYYAIAHKFRDRRSEIGGQTSDF